jgi:hypothetical protein
MLDWTKFKSAKRILVIDPDTKGSWGLIEGGRLVSVFNFPKPHRLSWTPDNSKNGSVAIVDTTSISTLTDLDVVFIEEQFQKMREGGKITSYHTFARIIEACGQTDVYAISPKKWHTFCRGCVNLIGDFPKGTRIPTDVTKRNSLAYALMYEPDIMSRHKRSIRGKSEHEYTQSIADVIVMSHWITRNILEVTC